MFAVSLSNPALTSDLQTVPSSAGPVPPFLPPPPKGRLLLSKKHSQEDPLNLPLSESQDLKIPTLPRSSVRVPECPYEGGPPGVGGPGPGARLFSGTGTERADLFPLHVSRSQEASRSACSSHTDLTDEVPLTSGARRHRFSQRSLSSYSGSPHPGPIS